MGLALQVLPADVDETPRDGERPADYVRRIAAAKCDLSPSASPPAAGAAGLPDAAPPVVGARTPR